MREAERSIDLEKLIGLTMMIEPHVELKPAPEHTERPEDIIPEDTKAVEPLVAPIAPVVQDDPVDELQAEALTSVSKKVACIAGPSQIDFSDQEPLIQTLAADPSLTITKVPIKAEVTETPKHPPGEVVVLDSDDEETRQPVIDLSDEDTTTTATTTATTTTNHQHQEKPHEQHKQHEPEGAYRDPQHMPQMSANMQIYKRLEKAFLLLLSQQKRGLQMCALSIHGQQQG